MFIIVVYKDVPELSSLRRRSLEPDPSEEKTLLVNPKCHVRVILEYIRKKCKLGIFSQFDLCDDSGALKGLFGLPTYQHATELFEHKKTYFIIVLRTESDKRISVLPQINRENKMYDELKAKVKKCLEDTNLQSVATGKVTPPTPTKNSLGKVASSKGTPPKRK